MIPRPDPSRRASLSAICVLGGTIAAVAALAWSLVATVGTLRLGPTGTASATSELPIGAETSVSPLLVESIASVLDADLLAGIWFVLDRDNSQVHRVDARGVFLGSFAGEGEGAGEFRSPRALAVHGDTIVVAARRSLHLYRSDGTAILSRRLEPPEDCQNARVNDVASSPAGLLLLYVCGPTGEIEALVMLEVEEANYRHLTVRLGELHDDRVWVAFRDLAVLSSHPRGFLFGHPNDPCLVIFDLNGQGLESVCHEWIDRQPLTQPDHDEWAEVRSGARRIGVRLMIPQQYPPFDRVFVVKDGGLVYRAPTAERIDMSRLVTTADHDLSTVVSPAPAVFVADTSVLAAWDELSGTRIVVYNTSG